MALSHAEGQISFDKRLRELVDTFLGELLEVSSCNYAFFVRLEGRGDSFALASRAGTYPNIDWFNLAGLIWRAVKANPEYLVIGREEIDNGPRLGPLAEHFEAGFLDVLAALPLMKDRSLIAVCCLFGTVPPADPVELKGALRTRCEGLAKVTANAVAAILESSERPATQDVRSEALKGLPEGVLIADHSGIVLEANDAFCSLIGIPLDSLVGRDLLHQSLLTEDCDYLVARLLETGQPFEVITAQGGSADRFPDQLDEDIPSDGKFIRFRGTAYPAQNETQGGMVLLAEDVTRDVIARREANRRERRYSQEIELAKRLQQDFFPANYQKKRIRITTRLILAAELAGDFFDIFNLGPNTIGLVMGDVVGKGIPGSLMAMSVHGMLANQAGALTPPMRVLERVSDALNHQLKSDYWYATCFYAKVHVTQLRVTYARAGFELPLWWHHDTTEVSFLEGDGLPLGIFPGNQYETHQVTLSEGDRLLLYTDGLTDTVNRAGERFGHDRLVELFQKYCNLSSKNLLNVIEHAVTQFRAGGELLDDIALALITVVPDSWTTLTIPPYSFSEILEGLMNELALKGIDDETRFRVRLSLDECVTNAYRHGHRYDDRKPITVSYLVEANRVTAKVRDCGQGFDFGLIPDPTLEENLMSPGGRGVFLTLKMMDEVTFNDVGNEITLVKYLHAGRDSQ